MIVEGRVGRMIGGDGAEEALRLSRDMAQVVTDGHARYAESVLQGNVFTGWWSGGTPGTVVAGNVGAAGALAGAATVLAALHNPLNSGVNLILDSLSLGTISGTIPATGPVWLSAFSGGGSSAVATPGSVNNGVVNNKLGSGPNPSGRLVVQAALSGSPAITPLRPLFTPPAVSAAVREETAGEIVIPQGAGIVIVPSGAGTTWITTGSITWEEIAL